MSAASPRVLILGASGLLGSHLAARLPLSFETRLPERRPQVDSLDSVRDVLAAARPDVVVNAIGAKPGADVATLMQVNAAFPIALASCCAALGARVVHISSDGVFSGKRGGYAEADAADPADDHGRSKLAGELPIPHLTLRTSFFGRTERGSGLIEWLAAQRTPSVDGFTDYRFTGMAAALLADLIAAAIAAELSGLYHVGGDPISKHELLTAAASRLQLNLTVRPVSHGHVDRTLDSSRFFAAIGRRRPTLAESMDALAPQRVVSHQ